MVKRSAIGILTREGVRSIYCHNKGDLNNVGKILREHYIEESKINELLDLGSISILGERLKPRVKMLHTFNRPEKGVTFAYGRDRGEPDQQPYGNIKVSKGDKLEEVMERYYNYYKKSSEIEYVYLYVPENNKWYCFYRKEGKKVIVDVSTGKELKIEQTRITRDEAIDMARLIRLNKGIVYQIIAKEGRVVIVEEDNDFYRGKGFRMIAKLDWDHMQEVTEQNLTQQFVADYIYEICNR